MAEPRRSDAAEHEYESLLAEESSNHVNTQLLPREAASYGTDAESVCHHHEKHLRLSRVGIFAVLLYFLVEMSDMISVGPLTALLEQSVCRSYFEVHNPSLISPEGWVREGLCKLESIQAELAVVRGWKLAFDTLPGKQKRIDLTRIIYRADMEQSSSSPFRSEEWPIGLGGGQCSF